MQIHKTQLNRVPSLTHERPTQHICCKKYTCTLPYTYLIKFYNMFVSVFYTYNLTYTQKKKLLFNIISLYRMSEHISKSELFCNKRNTVKSSTLHQNITILEMSCEYKKICGYEADQCHAYLKKIIYIYVLVQIISMLL